MTDKHISLAAAWLENIELFFVELQIFVKDMGYLPTHGEIKENHAMRQQYSHLYVFEDGCKYISGIDHGTHSRQIHSTVLSARNTVTVLSQLGLMLFTTDALERPIYEQPLSSALALAVEHRLE